MARIAMESGTQNGECFVRGALALTLHVSRALGMAPLRMKRARSGWRISYSTPFAIYSFFLTCLLRFLCYLHPPTSSNFHHKSASGGYPTLYAFRPVVVAILELFFPIISYSAITRVFDIKDALIFAALWFDMNNDVTETILTSSTTSRLAAMFEVIVIVVAVSVAVFQAKKRMKNIIGSQNILQKIQTDSKKQIKISTENKRHFCAVVCLLFASYPTFQYLYSDLTKVLQHGKSPLVVYLNATCYVELFILNLLSLQFLFVAMNIKSTFEGVNDIFEKRISLIENKKSSESNEPIRRITHSFATVCDVMRDIDDVFSDVLMLITSSFLMLLVVMPFYFFHNLLKGLTDATDIVLRAGTIVALIVSVMVVCEPGHRTEDELQRMRSLTDRLLQLVSANPHEDLALELDLLFKQINFNRVSYMPFDMFKLDRSFVLGVVGTAITLIVIVLQYQVIEQQSQMQNRGLNNITTVSL